MSKYRFIDEFGSFEWDNAENDPRLYFPLAGENGIKSAITPNLGGDCKTDQNHFLLEPVSAENLRNNRSVRNFWCLVKGKKPWSAVGASAWQEAARMTEEQETSKVCAGFMWHETECIGTECGLKSTITTFVDVTDPVEVTKAQIENITEEPIAVKMLAAIPIYGRSADNIRDHRHVTSLLHRIHTTEYGVHVTPTLSFDERGHRKNNCTYFTEGVSLAKETAALPEGFYPTMESLIGVSGTFTQPAALYQKEQYPLTEAGADIGGQEALGGISFKEVVLQPKESAIFITILGMEENLAPEEIERLRSRYFTAGGFEERLLNVKEYWKKKVRAKYYTGNEQFDNFMKWVSFQPELRRVFGCSFLPHHDYGRGGRGWRDLWQDCLALLLSDPSGVRSLLLSNYGGVRVDGTNATIIGDKQGEFKADRNSITRVWSDHGIWPFITTKLYLDQTGDFDFLYEEAPYFKDAQVMRGKDRDLKLTEEDPQMADNMQRDASGSLAKGSVLEHILTENLTSFYEVGEHNHILIRDADWNDALDLAGHRGETVAFTCALAMNLKEMAKLLERENARGQKEVTFMEELMILLDDAVSYDSIDEKNAALQQYLTAVKHAVSGEKVTVTTEWIAGRLNEMAEWIFAHVRETEFLQEDENKGWFNSYYDDNGRPLDGNGNMMLTGQVFAIMSGTANEEQIAKITAAADAHLYDKNCGGYRLNTNFHEVKMDMGRMFGFSYGEKENGAVFSHMTVMYANALYCRGFVKEGHKALQTLCDQSMNPEVSRIYPGIPEYFGAKGRGLYHYLTGAASWYMMTVITQVFGVRGEYGNLVIEPKLMPEQFDADGKAQLEIPFAGRECRFVFENAGKLAETKITKVLFDGEQQAFEVLNGGKKIRIGRSILEASDEKIVHEFQIVLGEE